MQLVQHRANGVVIAGAGVEGTVHTSGRKRQVRFGSQSFASDILSERQQQSLADTCEQQGASKVVSILVQKDSGNHASNGASSNGSNGVSTSALHVSHAAAAVGGDQRHHQSSSHVVAQAGTSSHTEEDSNVWVFTFEDTMHQGSAAAVQELQKGSWHHNNSNHKTLRLMMLTGDNEDSAQRVARQLNIADVKAGLSPEQKLQVMPDVTSPSVQQPHALHS